MKRKSNRDEQSEESEVGKWSGLEVSEQGLGCMWMSAYYDPPKLEEDMIGLIQGAVGKGGTLLGHGGELRAIYEWNAGGKSFEGRAWARG